MLGVCSPVGAQDGQVHVHGRPQTCVYHGGAGGGARVPSCPHFWLVSTQKLQVPYSQGLA